MTDLTSPKRADNETMRVQTCVEMQIALIFSAFCPNKHLHDCGVFGKRPEVKPERQEHRNMTCYRVKLERRACNAELLRIIALFALETQNVCMSINHASKHRLIMY